MPGLVVFRRRWSAGSDDLVVPGAILLIIHLLCLIMVIISLIMFDYDTSMLSVQMLLCHQVGYMIILIFTVCTELAICVISMRGSILDTERRTPINVWIYTKSVILLIDIMWLMLGSAWMINYYQSEVVGNLKKLFLAILLSNWAVVLVTIITVWCTFDAAGRSWVKMKKYQRSMRETETRLSYKRSNSINRNWRQRKVMRANQDSWNQRCRLLFCCIGSTERSRNSFADVARLLSDFFRELDVVPSDVIAGLVLLRKFQRLEREAIVRQRKNGTYEFLSGVPITEHTQFLALNDPKSYDFFQTVIHYMYFAQGAYGWPMYLYQYRSQMHHLLPEMRCFGCCHRHRDRDNDEEVQIIQDNCCYCNYAALKKTLQVGDVEIVYVTYHVDVGETPFFVAIDYSQKKIVVTIRGTLSMKDVLTDLNADSEVLPINPPHDDWLGHKGMVQAAIYIRNKLREENLVERALNKDRSRNTHTFDLVLVGHSLGAGTAAILAVLMRPEYPTLQCFSYSPPGGLLSMPVVEYSKSFITSVVLGKDVVPRIGLHQMEALRSDLINAIQRSIDPKWKTISCSIVCCGCGPEPTSVMEMSNKDSDINKYQEERDSARLTSTHPADNSIALTIHQPLYPPGRIIHIVRHHPKPDENIMSSREPVYQAIWADTTDFDEVLISPVMLQDHMPDEVLTALKKVVTASGPRKPHRQISNAFTLNCNNAPKCDDDDDVIVVNIPTTNQVSKSDLEGDSYLNDTNNCDVDVNLNQANICLETSFTNQGCTFLNHNKFRTAGSKASSSDASGEYSSVECDLSSAVDDSITTVTQRITPPPIQPLSIIATTPASEQKVVMFDIKSKCDHINRRTLKTHKLNGSPLYRQLSARFPSGQKHLFDITPPSHKRRASIAPNHLDLTYDEWFGLAPLASPETLSEISSISSRNSIRNTSHLTTGLERQLHNGCINNNNNSRLGTKSILDDIFESQLHTPVVLRRAPKFTENLSNCAEDSHNLDQYKRMSRVIITHPSFRPQPPASSDEDTDTDTDSFETAKSFKHKNNAQTTVINKAPNKLLDTERENSKSADQLDDFPSTQQHSGTEQKLLTSSDSNILNDNENYNNEDQFKRCNNSYNINGRIMIKDNCLGGSGDTTYYSANSSVERVTLATQPHVIFQTPTKKYSGLLESHFPVDEQQQQQQQQLNIVKTSPREAFKHKRFLVTDEINYSQLVQINEKVYNSAASSPKGRKRKACIYPLATATATATTITTNETAQYTKLQNPIQILSTSPTTQQSIIDHSASCYTFKSHNESSV